MAQTVLRSSMIDGVRLTEIVTTRGSITSHDHRAVHVQVVFEGATSDVGAGGREVLRAGDVLFHPAGSVHENVIPGCGGHGLLIDFAPDLAMPHVFGQSSSAFRTTIAKLNGTPYRLRDELRRGDDYSGWMLRGLVLELAATAARAALDQTSDRAPVWLQRVAARVESDLSRPWTVAEVADEAGASIHQLRDRWSRELGGSVGQWILTRRVQKAAELIAAGAEISDAALQCGFYDQAHLTRTFKRVYGTTPGAFRRTSRTALRFAK